MGTLQRRAPRGSHVEMLPERDRPKRSLLPILVLFVSYIASVSSRVLAPPSAPIQDTGLLLGDDFDFLMDPRIEDSHYGLSKRGYQVPSRYRLYPAQYKLRGSLRCKMWHWKTPSSCRFVSR